MNSTTPGEVFSGAPQASQPKRFPAEDRHGTAFPPNGSELLPRPPTWIWGGAPLAIQIGVRNGGRWPVQVTSSTGRQGFRVTWQTRPTAIEYMFESTG